MKSAELKRLDDFSTMVENIQRAQGMSINPAAFGMGHIEVVDRKDPVFGRDNGLALNSIETGNRLSTPLQSLVQVAAQNDDLRPECELLFPSVNVTGNNGLFRFLDRSGGINTMTSLADLERAVGAGVKLIDGHGKEVPGLCRSYGLGSEIDEDSCDDIEQALQDRVNEIMQLIGLFRLQLRLGILTALAANTNKVWNSTTNPNDDLRTAINAARVASGLRPTVAYFDDGAWSFRESAYESQATAAGFASIGQPETSLATKLRLRQVMISKALQRDSTGAISSVFGNKVLLLRNSPGASRNSDDFCKNFFCNDQGNPMRVHRREVVEKVWRVAVTWREVCLVTAPLTGDPVRQLTISQS